LDAGKSRLRHGREPGDRARRRQRTARTRLEGRHLRAPRGGGRARHCGADGRSADRGEPVLRRRADVSREEDVTRWFADASARLGPPDLLVNNAGIGVFGEIGKLTAESWERALGVNLRSAFLCAREVLPAMRARGSGYIVNISSVAGKKGMAGTAAYSASKFGMIGLSQSLQDEVKGQNIRVTAICPGYVATPLAEGAPVPAAEMIQPEDIAATVLYLLDLTPKVVIREMVIERIGAL
jgi:3-oxoacyl-[acyl-carrier protein] reductase